MCKTLAIPQDVARISEKRNLGYSLLLSNGSRMRLRTVNDLITKPAALFFEAGGTLAKAEELCARSSMAHNRKLTSTVIKMPRRGKPLFAHTTSTKPTNNRAEAPKKLRRG